MSEMVKEIKKDNRHEEKQTNKTSPYQTTNQNHTNKQTVNTVMKM